MRTKTTKAADNSLDLPGKARRTRWRLRLDGVAIDPTAAAAVTSGCHGKAGKMFAAGIMEAVEAGEDVEMVIAKALAAKVA